MAAGFIEKKGDTYHLYIFDREQDDYSFREGHELKTGDAYLSNVLGKLEKIYVTIPLEYLHFRILHLPFSDEKKIDDIIPFQLEGMTIESIDDIVYDFGVLGKEDTDHQVAVVFVKKDHLRRINQELALYGIRPELITNINMESALTGKSSQSLSEPRELGQDEKVEAMSRILAQGSINLAKDEFSYSGQMERVKNYLKYSAILLAVLSVLLSIHILLDIRNISVNEKRLKENMTDIYRMTVPGDKKIVNPLYQIKSRRKLVEQKAGELNDARPLNVMSSVAEVWDGESMVDSLSITGDLITLKGEAAGVGKAQSVADDLKKTFRGDATVETKQLPGGKTGFTVQIKLSKE